MWERGYRHNPLSVRNRYYLDHRPILPQDPTAQYFRRAFGNYDIIYFAFAVNSKYKYVLSNNIPVEDREAIKELSAYNTYVLENLNKIAIIPTFFLAGSLFSVMKLKLKALNILAASVIYLGTTNMLKALVSLRYSDIMSYYYNKYSHIAVDNLRDIEDPRRKFFKLDTTSYYRESANEILHKQHHAEGHGHHDTSTYYGPHPVNIIILIF